MTSAIIIGSVVGFLLGLYSLHQRLTIASLIKDLNDSKERFGITYDLLWMQVRDKNDLTYDNMVSLIASMQEMKFHPAVRETLAKRITGESNTHKVIGFTK